MVGRWSTPCVLASCLVASLLAGCTGNATRTNEVLESSTLAPDVEAATSDTLGGIRGVVVDLAPRPIPGAVVHLVGTSRNATTNARGSFAFDLLQPGTYFLAASAPTFLASQGSAQVTAGVAAIVRLMLEADRSLQPYHTTVKFRGFAEFDAGPVPDSAPMQCNCTWWVYPDPAFQTFVVEGSGTTTYHPVDQPIVPAFSKVLYWTFLDRPMTHGTGYNYTDLPFTSRVPGSLFLNDTSEIALTIGGNPTFPVGTMDFSMFVTTFYVKPAPPSWSFLAGDE